jgi:uncharacterized protein YbjT (DUF2867 family)
MRIILFGASGMVGQGVLRECLRDDEVERVLSIGRGPLGVEHAKLEEITHADFTHFEPLESRLQGYDACFYCLGVSAAGLKEAEYTRVTYDFTLAAAELLARLNPGMTFIYVSGAGTDSSEHGRAMWARVKGKTENALLRLPFKAAYMFRPGLIQPKHGVKSRTRVYRVFYATTGWLLPLVRALFPKWVTTTEQVGRAMLEVAKRGAPTPVLANRDINALTAAKV